MLLSRLNFSQIPTVGFAHHFSANTGYRFQYEKYTGLEIVYVKSGGLIVKYNNTEYKIDEESIFLLPRHLPLELYTDKNYPHSHCSMQLIFDFDIELIDEEDVLSFPDSLIFPLITPLCKETEEIKKLLYKAVSDLGISREEYNLSSAIIGLSILQKLNAIYKSNYLPKHSAQNILKYQIKKYISENIHSDFTIKDMAEKLHKSPNYLNNIFKKEAGISIRQYINIEKARIISEMMQNSNISFKLACENVGIYDISYGYRLFKKQMGVTPSEFLKAQKTRKNK